MYLSVKRSILEDGIGYSALQEKKILIKEEILIIRRQDKSNKKSAGGALLAWSDGIGVHCMVVLFSVNRRISDIFRFLRVCLN